MHLTFILPCVGKIQGKKYIRAWQMEPLSIAQLAALTPADIEISFWDDRMEDIPFDKLTDLVAINIETYTAKRAYQIAAEYRKRNIKVVMGGFHASLCPDEVAEYADIVVIGQAEKIWGKVILEFKSGTYQKFYKSNEADRHMDIMPLRSIYQNKDYLKITLLEAGRGCKFKCDFCAVQKFYEGKHHYRKIELVLQEIKLLKQKSGLFFFVDDNITSDQQHAKELFKQLKPLKIKWVGQADMTIAYDNELLKLMAESGCVGVLIGFESLNIENLKIMNKSFNKIHGDTNEAIQRIHKAGIRIYATFLFGYDNDKKEDFEKVYRFCRNNKLFMVAFNHLTPFPGTELYARLKKNNLLLYDKWWLNDNYRYGQVPFKSILPPEIIESECKKARKKFYSISSILYRMTNIRNINSFSIFIYYLLINLMLKKDSTERYQMPLGGFKSDD